ncbi:putative HECT domain, Zinc finger, RanBP2-type, HECT, E3 ligase catalytic domain-containing protein [Plasmopara halstedii]
MQAGLKNFPLQPCFSNLRSMRGFPEAMMFVKSVARATRQRFIILVAADILLCMMMPIAPRGIDTQTLQLRRALEIVDDRNDMTSRALMPVIDGRYSNITGEYEYYHENDGDDYGCMGSSDGISCGKIAIIGASIGLGLIAITICLTWKACIECCTRSSRRSRHRAYIERPNCGWKCEVCRHTNEISSSECVLCGTSPEAQSNNASVVVASHVEGGTHSAPDYLLLSSPRSDSGHSVKRSDSSSLTDRQLVARDRHKWKRCIAGPNVRWVKIPFEALQDNKALCSTITNERDYQEWQKQQTVHLKPAPSMGSVRGRRRPLTPLNLDTAFVRDDSGSDSQVVVWRLADEYSASSRKYSKTIMRASTLSFLEKTQWFYQYSLKLCPSIVDGHHTIRIHRDRVIEQSMALFMSTPIGTLHRRLRVDFMGEAGVDGGGLLREWLHLVCNELFSETQGLFTLTSSSAHQGYWILRASKEDVTKQLKMYIFLGKLLGKALLEGLLLNVRLSIPLLKHILGVPLTFYDLYLLDETVYFSMRWILENNKSSTLGLNFTVEGVELVPCGSNVFLHEGNKQLYVAKVAQYYLFDSVQAELSSIIEGLNSVINDPVLHVFDYKEFDLLLSGLPHIDISDWKQYTEVRFLEESSHEFEVITWFWEIVESFSHDQCSRLLQYVTGSRGIPVEGFKGLTGTDGEIQLFTIQLGKNVETTYTILPHASTCANRLDLPLYSSKAELERILTMVVEMDVTGFNSR